MAYDPISGGMEGYHNARAAGNNVWDSLNIGWSPGYHLLTLVDDLHSGRMDPGQFGASLAMTIITRGKFSAERPRFFPRGPQRRIPFVRRKSEC